MKTINDLKPGDETRVIRIHGSGPLRKRVLDMGLTKGATIMAIKKAPLGDPVEIRVRDYDLSLRNSEAKIVEVE